MKRCIDNNLDAFILIIFMFPKCRLQRKLIFSVNFFWFAPPTTLCAAYVQWATKKIAAELHKFREHCRTFYSRPSFPEFSRITTTSYIYMLD